MPAAAAYGIIGGVDRYLLQEHGALESVAVYGIAMKFFILISIPISAFHLAFGPIAYSRAKEADAPLFYARSFALYLAVACGGALLVALAAPWIVDVLATSRYSGAGGPAMWLVFAAVAHGAYSIGGLGITLARRTALLGWTAGGAALVAIVANLVLTPRFGASGAAAATCLAYSASALFAYLVSQRTHALPYRGGRLALVFGASLALGLIVEYAAPSGWPRLIAGIPALLAFGALVWRLEVWRDRGAVRHRPDAPWTSSGGS